MVANNVGRASQSLKVIGALNNSRYREMNKILNNVAKNYSNIIIPRNTISNQISDLTRGVAQIPATKIQSVLEMSKITPGVSQISNMQSKFIIPDILDSYNALLKSSRKSIERFTKSWSEIYDSALKIANDRCKEETPMVMDLAKSGWVISPLWPMKVLDSYKNLTHEERISAIEEYYTVDNHKNLFNELDILIEKFGSNDDEKGYFIQLQQIRELLSTDFKYYKVLMSTITGIVEYKYIQKIGMLNTNNILRYNNVKNILTNGVTGTFNPMQLLEFNSLFNVLSGFTTNSKFQDGIDNTPFTRHSIQHARFNPVRYKKSHLIKLVILLEALTFDSILSPELNSK
ncbi:hypothetical protein [Companilactobacillus mishanensis]|uniref:Uncharacterized protein n=1 Tax=Companilactobacillus mishanensis TaxID=2486008 RepID=A0A5P0ZKE3_9LACO|nr:hypothetical protein [Companilactobacillus mishanensis]MQS53455.1 hypothetical protein [Companilactobacillus mishanensis]